MAGHADNPFARETRLEVGETAGKRRLLGNSRGPRHPASLADIAGLAPRRVATADSTMRASVTPSAFPSVMRTPEFAGTYNPQSRRLMEAWRARTEERMQQQGVPNAFATQARATELPDQIATDWRVQQRSLGLQQYAALSNASRPMTSAWASARAQYPGVQVQDQAQVLRDVRARMEQLRAMRREESHGGA